MKCPESGAKTLVLILILCITLVKAGIVAYLRPFRIQISPTPNPNLNLTDNVATNAKVI